jgi:hypothetical protein
MSVSAGSSKRKQRDSDDDEFNEAELPPVDDEDDNDDDDDEDEDDDDLAESDDDDDDADDAGVRKKAATTPRRPRKQSSGGLSVAKRKAQIKEANRERDQTKEMLAIAANFVAKPEEYVFFDGASLQRSCKSLGIPCVRARRRTDFAKGIYVQKQDEDTMNWLLEERDRKNAGAAERQRLARQVELSAAAAQVERDEERRQAAAGAFASDGFFELLQTEFNVARDSFDALAVMRIAGRACAMSDNDSKQRVLAAFRQVKLQSEQLSELLARCDVKLPAPQDVAAELRESVLSALCGDDSISLMGLIRDLSELHQKHFAGTWRTRLAALCAPFLDLNACANVDLPASDVKELVAMIEADPNHTFDVDEGIVALARFDEFEVVGKRQQSKFDRVLREKGVVGKLPQYLTNLRDGLADRDVERRRLNLLTVAQLRDIARLRSINLKGHTRKDDIVARVFEAYAQLDAASRFDQLLETDWSFRHTVDGVGEIRQFLEARDAADLIVGTCEAFYSKMVDCPPAFNARTTATKCAADALAERQAAVFDGYCIVRCTTHTWNGTVVQCSAVEQARASLTDTAAIVQNAQSTSVAVRDAVARAEAAQMDWLRAQHDLRIVHRERKAHLDVLLAQVGVAATTLLWDKVPAEKATLRAPPQVYGADLPVLCSVVNDLGRPIAIPPIVTMRLQRRLMLLDALRRAGVTDESAVPLHVDQDTVVHTFLVGKRCIRTRSLFVGDVAAAEAAGDPFLSLPLFVFFNICQRMAPDDMINMASVSDAFALAAAVWTVNEKRAASAFSHRPKVVAPTPVYYGGYRRRWRRRW